MIMIYLQILPIDTKHISGEQFSCNYAYIIRFQLEIKQMRILSKDVLPLTNTPDYL